MWPGTIMVKWLSMPSSRPSSTAKRKAAAKKAPNERRAFSTPLVISVGNKDQVVIPGAQCVYSYDPDSGKELWRVTYTGFSNVPRPVFGRGLVFIATGFQQPTLIAVRPDGRGDVTRTHIAWTLTRGAPFTPSPLVAGDELYVISDSGILSVLDAVSGRLHYQQRLGGNFSASPVLADGRLYFLSEEGVTTVVAPGTTFNRLAVNRLDAVALASMAVVDGAIVVRSQSHLYRLGASSSPSRRSKLLF